MRFCQTNPESMAARQGEKVSKLFRKAFWISIAVSGLGQFPLAWAEGALNPSPTPSDAQAVVPSAAQAYVRMTLSRHPELLQAEAQSRAAQSQAREAQALRSPRLSALANAGAEHQRLDLAGVTHHYKQSQGQLRMTVPIYDTGLSAQIEQREQASLSADWKLVDRREDLMLRTLEAYAEVVRATQMHRLSQAHLAMHRDYVKQVKAITRLDLGRAADLPTAQGRVALAESVNISRLASLEQARSAFRHLTGVAVVQDLSPLAVFVPAASLDEAYQAALKASPALQVAKADIEAARQGVQLAKAPYQPRLNLDASTRRGRDWGGIKGDQTDHYLGVQAEWSFWQGKAQSHAIHAASENEAASRYAHEKARDELQLRVSNAWYEYLAHGQARNAYADYVSHAEAMVETSRQQFRIGRRNLLDVLNAENELFTARSNHLAAEVDQIKAAWRLVGLQGQLASVLGF